MEDWRKIIADSKRRDDEAYLLRRQQEDEERLRRNAEEKRQEQKKFDEIRQLNIDMAQAIEAKETLEYVQKDVWKMGQIRVTDKPIIEKDGHNNMRVFGHELSYTLEAPIRQSYQDYVVVGRGPSTPGYDTDYPGTPIWSPKGPTYYKDTWTFLTVTFKNYDERFVGLGSMGRRESKLRIYSASGIPDDGIQYSQEIVDVSSFGYDQPHLDREKCLASANDVRSALQLVIAKDCQTRTEEGRIPPSTARRRIYHGF